MAEQTPHGNPDQQSESGRARDASFTPSRQNIDAILANHNNVLIEGAPGAGKSCLLAQLALRTIEPDESSPPQRSYPVKVSARTLAGITGEGFASSLRDAVMTELGGRLDADLPRNMFARPPVAGKRWLVLIDALDEIMDRRVRTRLLDSITFLASDSRAPYRFLVTTRPVRETTRLSPPVFSTYRILPFDRSQIGQFVRSWFARRSGGGADDCARFMSQIERTQIIDLLRVPLMLTMAVLVYEEDPFRQMPARRSGLYERFLQTLDEEEAERDSLIEFRRHWDRRYGREGETWADEVFSSRRALIEEIALWQQSGGAGTILDEVTRRLKERWLPSKKELDATWLREQAEILLTRTGVIAPGSGDLDFLHETVREYLAAIRLLRDIPEPSGADALTLVNKWEDARWRQIVLFALGAWSERGYDASAVLRHIASGLGDGLLFAGLAMTEGVQTSSEFQHYVIGQLSATLRRMTWGEMLFSHPSPLEVLSACRDRAQVVDHLLGIARDASVDPRTRTEITKRLVTLGRGPEVTRLLREIVADDRQRAAIRQGAAVVMGRLGHIREIAPVLESIGCDSQVGAGLRKGAVDALGEFGVADSLLRLGENTALDCRVRERAGVLLQRLGDLKHGSRILRDVVRDESAEARIRERALAAIAAFSTADLADLADDEITNFWLRERAAARLGLSEYREQAVGILVRLARDDRIDERVRRRAIISLQRLRQHALLAELAGPDTRDELIRERAAQAALELGEGDDQVAVLRSLCQTAGPTVRRKAASTLAAHGHTEGVTVLLSLATDGSIDSWNRESAVISLGELHKIPELLQLARNHDLPLWLRVSAVCELSALRPHGIWELAEALESLAGVIDDPEVDGWIRDRLRKVSDTASTAR